MKSKQPTPFRVCIIGLGRFGSYLRARLADVGIQAEGVDICTDALKKEEASKSLRSANFIIFAVPIRHLPQAIKDYAPHIAKSAVVMDVCSVKVWPCHLLSRIHGIKTLVGTHPLFGPQSAPTSCHGQRVALCKVKGSTKRVEQLLNKLGVRIIKCTAHEHDKQMESQLKDHFIGRTAQADKITRVELSTKTHDLLMNVIDIISGNSFELFLDMNLYNPYARKARRGFIAQAQKLDRMISKLENTKQGRAIRALAVPCP